MYALTDVYYTHNIKSFYKSSSDRRKQKSRFYVYKSHNQCVFTIPLNKDFENAYYSEAQTRKIQSILNKNERNKIENHFYELCVK